MNLYKTFNQQRRNKNIVIGRVSANGEHANSYDITLSDGLVLKNMWSRAHTLSMGMPVILMHDTDAGRYTVVDRASSYTTGYKEVRV